MNITIKDIPKALHERLREEAEESGRSLNKLILHTLEGAVLPRRNSREDLHDRIRKCRESMGVEVDSEHLKEIIEEGRA